MKRKILYFILAISVMFILVCVAYKYGRNQTSNTVSLQSNTEKTEETLDAWLTKWGKEVTNYCQSDIFSTISPEFQRATSLVLQRFWENENTKYQQLIYIRANQSCLDIRYAASENEMLGADGVFLFSQENSSSKGLKILVNPEYKLQDDLTTALLLSHELIHAEQFILQDVSNRVIRKCIHEASQLFCNNLKSIKYLGFYLEESPNVCVRREAQAYFSEIMFYSVLKKVETDTINLRAMNVQSSQANLPVYGFLIKLNELSKRCPLNTTEDINNFNNCLSNVYIRSNPFYQKQCNL